MINFGLFLLAVISIEARTLKEGENNRISNGKDARIEEFPYILALRLNGEFSHSAIILNEEWALTLASTIYLAGNSSIILRAGSSYRDSGGTISFVDHAVIHPNFNLETMDYNYALLKVNRAFRTSRQIQPAQMAPQGWMVPPYTEALVAGWGNMDNGEDFSLNLKCATVYTLSTTVCELLNDKWIKQTPRMLCANLIGERSNPCVGDRGGPLVVRGVLVGMVMTEVCDQPFLQSNVYASVSDQRDWIDSIITQPKESVWSQGRASLGIQQILPGS